MFNFLTRLWGERAVQHAPETVGGTPFPTTPPVTWDMTHSDSAAGSPVSRDAVMGYPPTRRAILWLANRVAGLPIFSLRYYDDDNRERDYLDAGYKLLMERPNPWQTPFEVKRELVIDACFGDGYLAIDRNEYAEPIRFTRLDPDITEEKIINGDPWYKTRINDEERIYSYLDVFHLKSAGADGFARKLTSIARESLGLSLSVQNFASRYFKEGRGGFTHITVPAPVWDKKTTRDEFIDGMRRTYEGQNNAHKIVFTRDGVGVESKDVDNENSQMLATQEFALVQSANLIGVEPIDLGAKIATSYASLKERTQAALDNALNPWLIQIEEEANLKLRKTFDAKVGRRYYEFERKALLSLNPQEEQKMVIDYVNNGLMSVELGIKKLNLPTKVEGETYRTPSNVKVEGEEPQPQPQQQQPAIEPQPAMMEDPQRTAKQLTRIQVDRLLNRLSKGNGKLETHKQVFEETLSPCPNAQRTIGNLFNQIEEEYNSILPEQRSTLINKLDPQTLNEELWKNAI